MGKRSNNGLTYHQCDLTSFPMAKATCQFPTWRLGEDGKEKFSKVLDIGSRCGLRLWVGGTGAAPWEV